MSALHVIIDQPLPPSQDFRALKAEGLAYIQEHSGHEWTNLNNVDPGVTILDQVVYALTELGYCNDFAIADILTGPDGTIEVKDQFYLPEEILTTAPVTIADYRKCLIDGVYGITNAVIVTVSGGNPAYQVYLQPDPSVSTAAAMEDLCRAAYIYLNKWRNLGEMFLRPLCLTGDPHMVAGQIHIEDEAQLSTVLMQLQQRIQHFIFPKVQPIQYDTLRTGSVETEEIFNGPLLRNGWIPTAALGEKKDQLQLIELQQLINHVPGVRNVTGLTFAQQPVGDAIHTTGDKLLLIDWLTSLNSGLEIYCKGRKLNAASHLQSMSAGKPQPSYGGLLFGVAASRYTTPPAGKFRAVNSYYSIQNTFPEIFAVGADATVANATAFQIAQSRQLKGYLTLFDQVLANQFSQLANIGTLFSFKNAVSGTPSEQTSFYAGKDQFEKIHPGYPVPYLAFSPTYFYQSLYAVPHIRPLLKDNGIYNFSIEAESEQELDYNSWIAYKKDPYNPYIKGLMDIMEDDLTSLLRRNDILDHLLARHGESAPLINSILNGSSYAGESLKDQVIFKSLYLQNLGFLSYFRQKACDYLASHNLLNLLTDVPENFERQIMGGPTHDFVFNTEKIDRVERLTESDFIDYSALELKLSLLFGLKVQYRDFIANYYDLAVKAGDLRLAMWMITERRGLIMIETGLLQSYAAVSAEAPQVILVFPAFIPQLNTEAFKTRLELFLQENMPVQISYRCVFLSSTMLEVLIIEFADWRNEFTKLAGGAANSRLAACASSLIRVINEINADSYA